MSYFFNGIIGELYLFHFAIYANSHICILQEMAIIQVSHETEMKGLEVKKGGN